MFWKKANGSPSPEPASQPTQAEDAALDAVANLLKAFGENAFDTDNVSAVETRAECDGWAQKITVGGGKNLDSGSEESKPFKRDFAGVRRYFTAQRSHEREFVGRSLGNLREAVHAFARCLTTTVGEDRAADERVGAQLGKLVGAGTSDKPIQSPIEKLSDRELEVLQLIGKGQTTAQIADKLCLSVKTIETYREHLKQKLNLRSGPELVRYAIEWSLSQS